MTDDMNRIELTLLLTLGAAIVAHAGRITGELGYAVGDDERRAIALKVEDVLTDVIVGMRAPGPRATLDEIAQVQHEIAMGAVVAVLGEPPAPAPKTQN